MASPRSPEPSGDLRSRDLLTPDSFLNGCSRNGTTGWPRTSNALGKARTSGYNGRHRLGTDRHTLPRGLDRNQMERLASLDFVRKGDNLVYNPAVPGTGQSFTWPQLWVRRPTRPEACPVLKRHLTDGPHTIAKTKEQSKQS